MIQRVKGFNKFILIVSVFCPLFSMVHHVSIICIIQRRVL